MDIKDYLYAIRRRLWLPIALPIAAALLTAGFMYIQPEKYQATATVIVPALSARGYSTSAVTQYFSTYKDVLTSVPVIDDVSKQTGESKTDLAAGLTASTSTASSNIILVTYTGHNRQNVLTVVQYAAVDALDTLLGPQVAAAQSAVATGATALQGANQDLNGFTARTGLLFPDVDYKVQSQELSQLEVQLTQSQLAKDTKRSNSLSKVVADRQKALVILASEVIEYNGLAQSLHAAEAVYNKAHVDLNAANAAVASDHDPRAVVVRFVGHVSRAPEILRFAAVAAGVAMLLSLAYIVFMEFIHPAAPSVVSGWPLAILPGRRNRVRVPAGVATTDVSGQAAQPPNTGTAGLRRTRGRMQAGVTTNVAVPEQAPGPPTAGPAERSNGEL